MAKGDLALLMPAIAARPQEQDDAPAALADQAAEQLRGEPARRAIVDADIADAADIGHVGHQRRHGHAARAQRANGGAHERMIERNDCDAVARLDRLELSRQRVGIETLDPMYRDGDVVIHRRGRRFELVGEQREVAVRAARQDRVEMQLRRRGRGGFGDIADARGDIDHQPARLVAHDAASVERAIDGRQRDARLARDMRHGRTCDFPVEVHRVRRSIARFPFLAD